MGYSVANIRVYYGTGKYVHIIQSKMGRAKMNPEVAGEVVKDIDPRAPNQGRAPSHVKGLHPIRQD